MSRKGAKGDSTYSGVYLERSGARIVALCSTYVYTSLIRPILDYNGFLFDSIASRKIETLQIIQSKALRTVTGAMHTTSILALHAETNIPFLSLRRKDQLLRFYARSLSFPQNLSCEITSRTFHERDLTHLQRQYPLISYRIREAMALFQITQISILPNPPPISSFFLDKINTSFLYTNSKKSVTQEESLQLFYEFHEQHKDYTFIYTDGSVCNRRVAAAIASDQYEKVNRLNDQHSIFTAELIAIQAAVKYIKYNNNITKAFICTDSPRLLRPTRYGNTKNTT